MGTRSAQAAELDISYVLPTFDRAEYLGECLWTLVEQKYPKDKYEVIVVDDGSTDSTRELMDFYTSEYPFVKYYRLNHKGVEKARNYGNLKAHAPLIGVCDSDDLYHEDRTRLTVHFFKTHPAAAITNGSYIEIDHRGLPVNAYRAIKLDKKAFLAGQQAYFCHDNCAYRKELILKTPYRPDGGQTDDWKLVHDWLKAGYAFGFIDKELCKVRTLNRGIMGARRAQRGVKLSYA